MSNLLFIDFYDSFTFKYVTTAYNTLTLRTTYLIHGI